MHSREHMILHRTLFLTFKTTLPGCVPSVRLCVSSMFVCNFTGLCAWFTLRLFDIAIRQACDYLIHSQGWEKYAPSNTNTNTNTFLAATKQLYKWYFPSVRLSICPSVRHTFLTMFPSLYHLEIFRSYYQ